jgi:hypothetical protein
MGIELVELDMLQDNLTVLGRNDVVLLTAVVEHLSGSPLSLMNKVKDIIAEDGYLIFEVPNIAEFKKRVLFLVGRSPLPKYEYYLYSAYPFCGHNREMTMQEVKLLMQSTGYEVDFLKCYDYGIKTSSTLRGRMLNFLKKVMPLKDKGSSIILKAYPKHSE